METTIVILAVVAGIIGIIGSILPGLPGPPVSWVGMLLLFIWGPEAMPVSTLVIWGIVMVAVTIIDYWIPMYFTKVTGGSKHAERGALIGMILGAFLGAFVAEMAWANSDVGKSLKVAIGSFLGFMLGTGLKVIVSVLMMWKIFVYCF